MKWRVFVWIVRIAVVAAVLYGVWCGAAYLLGKHYFRAGMVALGTDPGQAVQRFEIAVKLQPRNGQYRAALGRAALKEGDFGQAAEQLQAAADLQPDRYDVWYDLGGAYLKANRPAEATRAFQRALHIRPEAPLVLEGLAEAATRAGDSKAALAPLRQLWKRSPTDIDLAGKLAEALVKEGQLDEALEVCTKAAKSAPTVEPGALRGGQQPKGDWAKWCPLLVAQGDAHRARGRYADAIVAYQRCLMIEHGHKAALDGLAKLPPEVCSQLAPEQRVRGPRLSPDGQQVAFYGAGLQVVSLATPAVRDVASGGKRVDDARPAWSPDGKRLCYSVEGTLHVVSSDGSGDHPLVKAKHFLPNGAAGVTRAGSGGEGLLYEVDPVWSPSGKAVAIYAQANHLQGRSLVVDVATGEARSVHHSSGKPPKFASTQPPAWSPDGRVLCAPLYYSGSTLPGVTLWSADGTVKRQLAAPREGVGLADVENAVREVSWSPDTKHLALVLRTGGGYPRYHLAIVPVSGKPAHIVVKDVVAHRWLDASHVWLLQATGDSYLSAGVRALTCDLQGNLKPAKERFPILLLDEWDLSRDRQRAVMAGQTFGQEGADKGLWVLDLRKLRGAM